MVTIDEAQGLLEELAEGLPKELYKELNGGILLLPDKKICNHAVSDDLFIMGEYRSEFVMGRYIIIYYGSFAAMYEHASKETWKQRLKETLYHEFVHHIENLAGERGLEIEDEQFIDDYLRKATTLPAPKRATSKLLRKIYK